jgi:hypothetical protein
MYFYHIMAMERQKSDSGDILSPTYIGSVSSHFGLKLSPKHSHRNHTSVRRPIGTTHHASTASSKCSETSLRVTET